jgi:hypothetical protein
LAVRLSKIDETNRPDHYYLGEEDRCYFFGEYTAGKGWAHSETNGLISNFKKPSSKRGLSEWKWKLSAIQQVSQNFRKAINRDWLQAAVLCPIPPSKRKSHPDYDPRVLATLQRIGPDLDLDVRELVLQSEDMPADHQLKEGQKRLKPAERARYYYINEKVADPAPSAIAVFDDVLTTGSHFAAMKIVLQERYPGVDVVGFFIARRVPEHAGDLD